jgi:hypothetical protein
MQIDTSKEPSLEDYNLTDSIYEEYAEKTKKLNELDRTVKHPIIEKISKIIIFPWVVAIYYLFAFIVALVLNSSNNTSLIFFISPWGIVATIGAILLLLVVWLLDSETGLNILTHGKHKEELERIERSEKRLKESIDSIKKRVGDFEKALIEFHTKQINNYFETNLYHKRSGNNEFENDLSEFALMLNEADEIEKTLIAHRFDWRFLGNHKDYLKGRQINHTYLKDTNNHERKIKSQFVNRLIEAKQNKEIPPEVMFRTPRKIDWDALHIQKKVSGEFGEEVALAYEIKYLKSIERNDLAEKVKHESVERGDGLGYDILSFFADGREKYIEVKTTKSSVSAGYYLSRNELKFLTEHRETAYIYRVQNDAQDSEPKLLAIRADEVLDTAQMIPTEYFVKAG